MKAVAQGGHAQDEARREGEKRSELFHTEKIEACGDYCLLLPVSGIATGRATAGLW